MVTIERLFKSGFSRCDVDLKPFLLDMWQDKYEHNIEFNLAASTGPSWTVNEVLDLAGEEERQRFLGHKLVYGRPAGADGLREAIAEMHNVSTECVQVVTGASEALLILMWLAAEPGANVILPRPGFTTFSALPESLGLETRLYPIRRENGFRIDVEEVEKLADRNTKLILVNSPHNPTGATINDAELDGLHEFTSSRGIQLVSDEVYHPIFHGQPTKSAARLPHATVIHDFSKAFPLSGVRTGWMIEHDTKRRKEYWTARAYFFMTEHQETIGWIPPRGGMTAFPWLTSGEDSRAFCQAAAERGILLAPGDCFDAPPHFRLGFAAMTDKFPEALGRLGELVKSRHSANMVKA